MAFTTRIFVVPALLLGLGLSSGCASEDDLEESESAINDQSLETIADDAKKALEEHKRVKASFVAAFNQAASAMTKPEHVVALANAATKASLGTSEAKAAGKAIQAYRSAVARAVNESSELRAWARANPAAGIVPATIQPLLDHVYAALEQTLAHDVANASVLDDWVKGMKSLPPAVASDIRLANVVANSKSLAVKAAASEVVSQLKAKLKAENPEVSDLLAKAKYDPQLFAKSVIQAQRDAKLTRFSKYATLLGFALMAADFALSIDGDFSVALDKAKEALSEGLSKAMDLLEEHPIMTIFGAEVLTAATWFMVKFPQGAGKVFGVLAVFLTAYTISERGGLGDAGETISDLSTIPAIVGAFVTGPLGAAILGASFVMAMVGSIIHREIEAGKVSAATRAILKEIQAKIGISDAAIETIATPAEPGRVLDLRDKLGLDAATIQSLAKERPWMITENPHVLVQGLDGMVSFSKTFNLQGQALLAFLQAPSGARLRMEDERAFFWDLSGTNTNQTRDRAGWCNVLWHGSSELKAAASALTCPRPFL